jgi:hypothetical protein
MRGKRLLLAVRDRVPTGNTVTLSPGPVQLWIKRHEVYDMTIQSGVLNAAHQGGHCSRRPSPILE